MISEGSCDTEAWSNDAENSVIITGINYILKYIQIKKVNLNCKNISQYYCFCCILDQINEASVNRSFLLKHFLKKTYCSNDICHHCIY